MMDNIKVVILCGGRGMRLHEETEFRPKPLVHIGHRPILWHIMKHYAHYGFKDFVLCLGYKGELIKEYFMNYDAMSQDFTLQLGSNHNRQRHTLPVEDWNITFIDTGHDAQTGGRVKRIEPYITDDYFMMTYGDGVSDVNLKRLLEYHKAKAKIGTITGVHPGSKYGTIKIDDNGIVAEFREKPMLKDIINGGFFVFRRDIFGYIHEDCMLEREPFEQLVEQRQMAMFKHEGFWHCMDTYKDFQDLNAMWDNGAPWKQWEK